MTDPRHVTHKPPRPLKTTTTQPAAVSPPPPPSSSLGDPTGVIGGPLKIAYGRGAPWADVNRYDALFTQAGQKHDVPPAMLKAMAVIESGGQMIPNAGGSGAYGIMQIKPAIWNARANQLGYYLNRPDGQIGMAAAILGGDTPGVTGTTPEERFLSTYYPTPCLDCKGEDGHTPRQYLADMHELMRQIDAAAGGITPAPSPPPPPNPHPADVDPIRVIVGGDYPPITYGFLYDAGINSYKYVVGHGGTRSTQHSGDDVPVRHGTRLYTPLPGKVTCVGTAGTVIWGEGCGSFLDDMYGGIGNITILFDDMDLKMTLGHCHTCVVNLGQHVSAGQQVGTSGGSNGDHVHIDIATIRNGSYWLLDPIPALQSAMGGVAPITYANPVDVPQPDDTPPYVIVRAIRETPVLQRANPKAPPIFEPLLVGTTFHAQSRLLGSDGRWYWVGRFRGRVAEADTEVVETVLAS